MSTPIRVLILEDRAADAELMLHELRRAGFDPDWQRVEAELEYLAALETNPDLILADWSLPQFGGLRALQIMRDRGLDIPFIIVSGSISEEAAVEAIRQGAADYLLKDRPARLGSAVRRALDDKQLRAERRRAEEALRNSEKRFRALFENSLDEVSIIAADGSLIYESPSVNPTLGYEAGEFLGQSLFQLVCPDDLELVQRTLTKLLQDNSFHPREQFRLRHRDGTWRWIEAVGTNLLAEPSVGGIVLNYHDITERKMAEEALLAERSLLRTLVDIFPDPIYVKDATGRKTLANPVDLLDMGAASEAEVLGKTDFEFFPSDLATAYAADDQRVLQSGESILNREEQITLPGGTRGWQLTSKVPLRDSAGRVVGLVGVGHDITARKQAEESLQRSQQETAHVNSLLVALGQAAQFVQRALTTEEVYLAIQAQMSNLGLHATGFELEQDGKHLRIAFISLRSDLVHKAENATGLSLHTFHFKPRADTIFQRTIVKGETIYVKDTAQAVADALPRSLRALSRPVAALFRLGPSIFAPLNLGEEKIGIFSITGASLSEADNPAVTAFANQAAITMQNSRLYTQAKQEITERKQTEEELLKSEGKFRAIFDNASTGMFIVDLKAQKFFMCNNTCVKILGYTKEEFLNLDIADIHPGEDMPFINEQIGKFSQGEEGIRSDIKFKRKNGSIFAADLSPALLTIADKEYLLISFIDITERKQREEEIRSRTDELSALYQLSRLLADASDLEHVIELVNRHAAESVHTTFACIALMEDGDLVMRAFYPVRVLDHEFSIGERQPLTALPVCQRVLDKNEPVILQAGSPEVGSLERLTLQLDFARSVCLVPLQAGDPSQNINQALGLLILGEAREEKREAFTPEKIRLAHGIGDQAAAAIRRLLLHEQAGRRLQNLASLSEIDRTIASSFDLRLNLQMILQHVIRQLKVDAADVLVLNHHLQTLEFTAGSGFHSPVSEHKRLRLGEGQAGQAALERHIIQIPDVATSGATFAQPEMVKAENIAAYFAVPLITKGQVMGVLEIYQRTPLDQNEEWLDFLNTLAGQAAIAIDNVQMFDSLQRTTDELELAYDATIEGWSHALDLRDKETEGHTLRVTEMTVNLARTFGLGENELLQVRWGALLHDIGKMGVPDGILLKPGPLTDKEWVAMKKHPTFAYEMLSPIHYLRLALDIPYCHHEKWDGTGYPRLLKGEQIPLTARIFAVVDVWDALTSDRPYRKAWTKEKAIDYIKAGAGSHFDPKVVEVFLKLKDVSEG